MKHEMTLGVTVPLPPPPSGWFNYAYAVLWNGDLALVRADRDIHAELGRWRDQMQRGNIQAPRPNLWDGRLRLTAFDGSAESGAIEVPACGSPGVARLPDGRWLVASARAAPKENNAHLYAADGAPAGTFAMGDGILHIQCAADGTIWVGYFDEGVFSGPMEEDGSWPISSSGIAHLGPDGSVLWKFNDQERADIFISDCYALTVDGPTLWCCPYTDFPIVRVDRDGVKYWRNKVAGANALAVEGDHVLLAGGYGDRSDRITLLRLGDDQAQQIGQWQLQRPDRSAAWLLQGHGDTLHMVGRGEWTKMSVATVRANRGLNSRTANGSSSRPTTASD
ncbi:hypothetical protein [Bradyrhizobium sp. USDA 4454]